MFLAEKFATRAANGSSSIRDSLNRLKLRKVNCFMLVPLD